MIIMEWIFTDLQPAGGDSSGLAAHLQLSFSFVSLVFSSSDISAVPR